jgi:hypothetical protein
MQSKIPSSGRSIYDSNGLDYKKKQAGEWINRMVVPATNVTAGFSNAGYRGIKHLLDKNEVNYTRKTIIQASDLKEKIEHTRRVQFIRLMQKRCTPQQLLDSLIKEQSTTFQVISYQVKKRQSTYGRSLEACGSNEKKAWTRELGGYWKLMWF